MKLLALTPVVAAALVLPAPASAAEVVGSDFSRLPESVPLTCADPCTVVSDEIGGAQIRLTGPAVITSFRAALGSGTAARLRVVRRSGGGSFTDVASSGLAFGDGSAKEFPTRVSVGAGEHTLGVDLLGGQIASAPARGSAWMLAPELGVGGAVGSGSMRDGEVMLSARAEPDRDADGLGDETEDPRVDVPGGTPGGGGTPEQPVTGPAPPPTETTGGDAKAAAFSIGPRAILRSGAAGAQGYIEVYATWPGSGTMGGTLDVRHGRRSLGRNAIEVGSGEDASWGNYRLAPAARRLLLRKGRLKLQATAKLEYPDGRTAVLRRPITVLAGGVTSAYDGVYQGPGPVRIVVERGVLTSITTSLRLFCSRSNQFLTRAFYGLSGFPTLINRDGSFNVKGSRSAETLTYRGRLRRKGVSSGYLSMFHTLFGLDASGRIASEQCFDARNWKVTRRR